MTPHDTAGPLLRGVDRAAFIAALSQRLRAAGIPVTLTAMSSFAEALQALTPDRLDRLYWLARLTLVNRQHDLETFDRVFDAVFRDALLPVDPHARRKPSPAVAEPEDDALAPVAGDPGGGEVSASLPWHTLPRMARDESTDETRVLPELLPSAVARLADTPLDTLDEAELALLGRWLEASAHRWPTRRSRRQTVRSTGQRVALRETIMASRRTGWEPMELRRYHQVRRPLTVTLVCDVSQSMQSYATAYLHLMRAFARTRRAETFAFSTSLTRLTPALTHQSAAAAVAQASDQVVDRFGGTHLASCLRELLASRHGNTVRGGVLVIASDGWDSDPPAELAAVMARAARRARRVVWLNPRAAAEGFEPLVGSMAAALPYCDAFLPADTLRSLPQVFDAIAGVSSRG
ncbi:vWA domain-containing protein [Nocardioides sp.]|uniref:vWA domain-containing protein n=1 Tax=Nocardioides sp. TaxID=35761 RepID=UPI003D10CA12